MDEDTSITVDGNAGRPCTTAMLSAFPFLTPEEFNCACQKFAERARSCTVAQAEGKWSSVRLITQVDPCDYSPPPCDLSD